MPLYKGISGLGIVNDKQTSVVIDFGHVYTKVGFAGETGPRAIIASKIKSSKTNKIEPVFEYKNENELRRSLVDFIDKIYFKHLLVNPKDRRVVVVENLLNPTVIRDTIAKVLFKHYEVLSVLFVPSHLVSLMTLGCSTGLVLDIGYQGATLIPVYEGVPILHAWQALPLGAKSIHSSLSALLLERGNCRGSAFEDKRLSSVLEELPEDVIEDIKVRACFVTTMERKDRLHQNRYDRAVEPPPPPPSIEYPYEGSKIISIPGTVREMAAEILFQIDEDGLNIPKMILEAILKCPVDLRRTLAENLVIMGGTASMMGVKHRILCEVRELSSTNQYKDRMNNIVFKLHKPPAKDNYVAWLGGAILGSTEAVGLRSLLKETYLQTNIVPDWCNLAYNHKEQKG